VAIQSQNGPVNLWGVDISAPRDVLTKIVDASKTLGVLPKDIQGSPSNGSIAVMFVSPRVHSGDVVKLVSRIRGGEFGVATVHTRTMGIETLPADKCLRI
jgi:hypothetical protein